MVELILSWLSDPWRSLPRLTQAAHREPASSQAVKPGSYGYSVEVLGQNLHLPGKAENLEALVPSSLNFLGNLRVPTPDHPVFPWLSLQNGRQIPLRNRKPESTGLGSEQFRLCLLPPHSEPMISCCTNENSKQKPFPCTSHLLMCKYPVVVFLL